MANGLVPPRATSDAGVSASASPAVFPGTTVRIDPATALVAAWGLLLLATWLPHYVLWPWWADHDVFATAAQAWDAGQRPYRDFRCNNFPGTIYLFYGLGKLAGWGQTWALWAVDGALGVGYAATAVAWSRRRFGTVAPGLIVAVGTLAYLMGLDYSQAAQRDAHAPLLGLLALMWLDLAPGLVGAGFSGLLLALALSVRPQAACFGPALLLAIAIGPRGDRAGRVAAWAVGLGLGIAAWVLPLAVSGLLPDFLASLRGTMSGGTYSQSSPLHVLAACVKQGLQPKVAATVAVLVAASWSRGPFRAAAWVGLASLAGVWVYGPVSPIAHAYLAHPLQLTWAWSMGVVTALVLARVPERGPRSLALLFLLALASPVWPRFCRPDATAQVLASLVRGDDAAAEALRPPGYVENPASPNAGRYDWDDYRRLLAYVRGEAAGGRPVANLLRRTAAVTGPTGAPTSLPAESIAWLTVVRSGEEDVFTSAMLRDPQTMVVWDPASEPLPHDPSLDGLMAAVRRQFEPSARFGALEVWTRREPGGWDTTEREPGGFRP